MAASQTPVFQQAPYASPRGTMQKPKTIQSLAAALLLITGCNASGDTSVAPDTAFTATCAGLPRPQNAVLPVSTASDDWFQVYETADGVYSIVEPFQFQETISHLIVGVDRALLFDTGLGLLPIRPVVERITSLPVTVLNSHTHYDHVGGNHEFSSVLARDTPYTRANMQGFRHERIASDLSSSAFCGGVPAGIDTSAAATRAWTASGYIGDGDVIELGKRQLQVIGVPGHTPDSIALFDEASGLLFTGDTYYDASLWLFVPETNLDDYQQSLSRLVAIESRARYLLGAHNIARVDAGQLARVQSAFRKLRAGSFDGESDPDGRLEAAVDGIVFITARPVLEGRQVDPARGGSGLDGWPDGGGLY